MNKYQKALNKLKSSSSVNMSEDVAIELLQELVDIYPEYLELKAKAAPMKLYTKANMTNKICPTCYLIFGLDKYNRHEEHKYCLNCGQALDWSEE